VCFLGLTACGESTKKKKAAEVPETEEIQATLTLSGTYKVSLQCADQEAQEHMMKTEGEVVFKDADLWEMTLKVTENCDQGCIYFSTGTYKANPQQLLMYQTYRANLDRKNESRKVLKLPMQIQALDEQHEKIVAVQDATSNQCGGPMIISFTKLKEEIE
jgi:hypothetical protein